jgi:ELWxxDGT repeat protein
VQRLVKDIVNDKYGSAPGEFIAFGGNALFSAFDGNGREVWRSDATYDGTYLVSDVQLSEFAFRRTERVHQGR